ncbi:hypothetical protein IQ254_00920 [Nodosilinea sp. LEGE 07088]|uniref:hypothetical protein n=1 Tax=Nodosilinea sp. LEGE 07088 TaxID=2777968 RepID=UPI00187F18E9|nr:hypothetical protein [Nodosilinea sp. LEGE 07088]MBE9135780.1 hypothetical protein [Nodosilinea sp. LEGE 07088]
MVQRSPYPVSSHYRQPPQAQSGSSSARPQPVPTGHSHQTTGGYSQAADLANPQLRPRALVAGGSMLALAALLITPNLGQDRAQEASASTCIKIEQSKSLVSRDKLAKLLEIDAQATRTTVREILQEPYCVMAEGKTEAGTPASREAYPLEFDPQTWLVVLYDSDRYVGYDFRFR